MRSRLVVPAICCAGLLVTACGGGSSGKATQVAVKVNRDEISIHQVNAQLSRLPANVPAEQRDEATRRVVAGLVDQQLFVQQALDRKLDRDPDVLAALEGARQQVLVQAYLQKTLALQAKPTEQEIKQYYNDNPALFGQRKVYKLQEITISAAPAPLDDLAGVVARAHGLQEVAVWLRDRQAQFSANAVVRGAEQLPLEALPAIAKLKDGEITLLKTAAGPTVMQVVASQSEPVDEHQAQPAIETYLTTRKRDQLAQGELKRLHDSAKIEYVGDFARFGTIAAGATGTAAPAAAAVPPAAPPTVEASAQKALVSEKGVAGLR